MLQGFTLIELAVVLVIIGTMLTLGLAAFNAQMTTGAYARTRAKIETIKSALIDHLGRHMYLPCPDRDFGPPPPPPDVRGAARRALARRSRQARNGFSTR